MEEGEAELEQPDQTEEQGENAQAVDAGTASWEEYRDTARLCKDGVRTGKAHLELELKWSAMNKKSIYRYINQKRKVQEGILPCEQQRQAGNYRQRKD